MSPNSITCPPTEIFFGQLNYLSANFRIVPPTQIIFCKLGNIWGDSLQIFLIHSCLASDMFIGYLFSKYATSKSTTTSGNTGPILMLLLTCNVMLKICYISLPLNFLYSNSMLQRVFYIDFYMMI